MICFTRFFAALVICWTLPTYAAAADSYHLGEEIEDQREYEVSTRLKVTGTMQASAGDKKNAIGMKLDLDAKLDYRERRMPSAGRNALSLRSARNYRDAHAKIVVGRQTTMPRLRSQNRLIVAEGQPQGVRFHSPQRPLYFTELELLQAPGDSLAALSLLPDKDVEIGDQWSLEGWAVQFFTGLEAVEKGAIACEVKALSDDLLEVHFSGEIKGAIYGAYTTVSVEGDYWFDIKENYLHKLELVQKEKRSIGVVSQGLEVEAQVTMTRTIAPGKPTISDSLLEKIPLNPNSANLLVAFDSSAWNLRFHHDRLWHLYKHERDAAAFRLVEKGSFIAQCKIAPLQDAKAGEHMSEEQFLKDIQTNLGENFQDVASMEQIKGDAVGGDEGLYIYRVESHGKIGEHEVIWIHMLIAAPDGRQVALIFTVGKEVRKVFADRDIALATNVEFLPAPKSTQQAAGDKAEPRTE